MHAGACLFPSKFAQYLNTHTYVYIQHSLHCPCCVAILRSSRSLGHRLRVSVTLLSSTEGLSDWWTDGSLVGMKVAVGTDGMSYKLRGITHACTRNGFKHTTQGRRWKEKVKGLKQRGRLSVWVEQCPMCLGALERFHAPISNETHTTRHTQTHTHCWAFSLPSYPHQMKKKKKHGTWWGTEEQR